LLGEPGVKGLSIMDDSPFYFCHSASLRIFGDIVDLSEITRIVGVNPSYMHSKGEMRSSRAKPYEHDMWLYEPDIPEDRSLSEHLDALWSAIERNAHGIKALKKSLKVDVFCGYRSNCDHAGFAVESSSLRIFHELEVPFSVSVIVLLNEGDEL